MTEAGQGMEALGRAGWDTDQIMAGIGETLTFATANSMDLGQASSVVADGLSQFGMKAEETGRFTDVLSMTARESNTDINLLADTLKYAGPVAGSLGYSLEDTSVAMALMANQGIKGSAAGTALRNIMTRMVKPTKESGQAMKDLGVSVTDANGEMKPFEEVLGDLRGAFANLTPEQKAQYAASIAGQQGMSGLLALVDASPEEFAAMSDAINDSSGVTQEMADTMDGGLGGAIEGVKSAWENMLIKFGELQEGIIVDALNFIADGLRVLPEVLEKVNEKWQQFKEYLDENSEAINSFWDTIKETFTVGIEFITEVFGKIKEIVMQFFETNKEYILGAMEGIKGIIEGAMNIIKGVLDLILGLISGDWERVWEGIKDIAKGVWEGIKGIVKVGINAVKIVIETIMMVIQGIFKTIWNAIKAIITGVIKGIAKVIKSVFNGIKDFISNVWNTVKNVTSNIWNGIKNTISNIVNGIKNVITNVFNAVKNTVSNIWNGIKNVTSNVWNGIKNTISNIVNGIKNTVSNIFNGLKNTVSNIFNGIKNIASNVWNGVKDAMTRPVEAARDTIKGVLDRIKGFFSSLKLKFPKLEMPPLPHFSLTGSFSLKPPSVPKLSVDWYKDGGILTQPTIFGVDGNSLMGGGEAGPEAVLPIEKLGGILADTMERLGYGNESRGREVIQNLTINTPKHLSPAETARENKKALQRLALEL